MKKAKTKIHAKKVWQFSEDSSFTNSSSNNQNSFLATDPPNAEEHKNTDSTAKNILKNLSDIDFLNDTDFIVCDSDGHCLHLFTATNAEKPSKTSDNQFIIKDCSNHKTPLINIHDDDDDDEDRSTYKHRILLKEKIWPSSIAVTKEGFVRLTDRRNKSIKTFDISTETIVGQWTNENLEPQGVAVCSSGETVVTDVVNNCVFIFDSQGQKLTSFGERGDLLHQFKLPFYTCVDDENQVYVCDNMNYCIKKFDLRGNFENSMGSSHVYGERKFKNPYGIAYDAPHKEILIADNENNKVLTYEKNGDFVRMLNSVNSPCGISVRNGQVALTLSSPQFSDVILFKLQET